MPFYHYLLFDVISFMVIAITLIFIILLWVTKKAYSLIYSHNKNSKMAQIENKWNFQ